MLDSFTAVPFSPASQRVLRSARRGNRARRLSVCRRVIDQIFPWIAAAACAASALALLTGRGQAIGIVLLAGSALAAAVALFAARLDRPPSDRQLAAIDRAARLEGALGSACWFARHRGASNHAADDERWIAYHVDHAAERAAGVDWARVYARPIARRRWMTTLILAAATIVLARLETPPVSLGWAAEQDADTIMVVPPHLAGDVVEGMNALKAGAPLSKDVLTAVGRAIEIARNDRNARRDLEDLFARTGGDPRWLDGESFGSHDWDVNERPDWDEGTPALEWAYEAAVARAALDDPSGASAPARTSRDEGGRTGRAGELQRGATAPLTQESAVLRADARGQTGSFSSFLFGRQRATDEAGTGPAASSTAPAGALAAALRREVVHARSDLPDAPPPTAARRAPDRVQPPASPTGIAPTGLTYESSRAARPPAIPDARRGLVHDFFVRATDVASAPARP